MKITNKASFTVRGTCWHQDYGKGKSKIIKPNQTKNLLGPRLGNQGNGEILCLIVPGVIICHEKKDNDSGCYYLSKDEPLILETYKFGVSVSYYSNK